MMTTHYIWIILIILIVIVIIIYNRSKQESFNVATTQEFVNILKSANSKIPDEIKQIMDNNQFNVINSVAQYKQKELEISQLEKQLKDINEKLSLFVSMS